MTIPVISRIFFLLLLILGPVFGLRAQDSLTYYEDAVSRYSNEDYKGAEVQLKNALQADPRHLPSRMLLGRVHIRLADPAAAEKEMLLALRLGAARDKVFPILGNAMLFQRKYEEVLEIITTVNPNTPEAEQVYIFRGRAYLGLNQLDEAWESFEQADLLKPDSLESLLGKADILTARADYAKAEILIDKALKLFPESEDVRYKKGLLRATRGDLATALEFYNQILSSNPNSYKTYYARAAIYLRQGLDEKSLEDLQIVHDNVPSDLNASFLYARVLGQLGRNDEANAVLAELAQYITRVKENVLESSPVLLRIATLLNYLNGDFEQAIIDGNSYLALKPRDIEMAKLVAAMQLRVGDEDAAIELLYRIHARRPDDAAVLALLGEAHLKKSRFGEASRLLEQAAALAPDNAAIGTQLSLGRFGLGLDQEGESELLRSFELNTADSVSAGFILAQLQLRKGETEAALVTARKLLEVQPRNPVFYNLLGAVQLQAGDFAAARAAFEMASRVSPGFLGSEYNLALLDIEQSHFDDARKRLAMLAEMYPQSFLVLMALADLELAEGQPDRAIPWLLKATALDSDSASPGIKLVDLYIEYQDFDNALRQAENLARLYPREPQALQALARAQVAKGREKDAVESLHNAMLKTDISKGMELINLADEQVRLGDYSGARKSLVRAGNSADAVNVQIAMIRLDLLTGDYKGAEQNLAKLNQLASSEIVPLMLLGDIRYAQKRYKDAYAAYNKSFDLSPSSLSAVGVFKSQFLMGHHDAAHIWLENWCVAHPEDAAARRELARSRLSTGKRSQARHDYEQLIKAGYGEAIDYSFLARIYQLDKDERALEMAESALKLDSKSARVLDVYGWILVTEGRASEGLRYLREAVSRDSDPYLRYHLASALNEVGRTNEARHELEAIFRIGQEFPWIASAQQLYDSLPN
jgi:putative PEP-CTERM system TPR-repeat lipoprotein